MLLRRLLLTDFRGYTQLDAQLVDGLNAILGKNGEGKTNLIEAISWLASLNSFRGAPNDALVRLGAERAIVRAEVDSDGREVLIEAEIPAKGRMRMQVNRQRLTRARDLVGVFQVSVFSPDDLELIKGGPSNRRVYLDETLVGRHQKHDRVRTDVDKVLKQRNALLKQAGGRLTPDIEATLDVWDDKLSVAGEALVAGRIDTLDALRPMIGEAYDQLAQSPAHVGADYLCSWGPESLLEALREQRKNDVRRGVTTVGPHRDELSLTIGTLASRTHASQGEQRSLAFALRIAAHRLITADIGQPPVLLLDDIFSELDPARSDALLEHLPPGQAILTSAAGLPPRAQPAQTMFIENHSLVFGSS